MDIDMEEAIEYFEENDYDWPSSSNENNMTSQLQAPNEHIKILNENFGHSSFRPMQWEIIQNVLFKKADQCVIMSTGYGKSLCFQYPPVYTNGCTIVVSPLISLMEDQVLSLQVSGISACLLGSAQTNKGGVISDIMENKYRLIYVTPEYCTGDAGTDLLRRMNSDLNITLLAIDEAHCVSHWGHDFRQSYRNLGKLRSILENVPVLAVTATATKSVQSDICKALKLKNPLLLSSGYDRPNLYFEVLPKGDKSIHADLLPYLNEAADGSVIIYTLTKKETENICSILQLQNFHCAAYHAGLSLKVRKSVHEKFIKDEIKIIVATIAFGMGIDKPDVRFVIHYGTSKDIESYYQEVGRAGRDGLPSKCITFFSNADFFMYQLIFKHSPVSAVMEERRNERMSIMKNYLYSDNCRREIILKYFEGEEKVSAYQKPKECCDNCKKKLTGDTVIYAGVDKDGLFDFTSDIDLLLETVYVMSGRFGLNTYISFMRGSNIAKIRTDLRKHKLFGAGKKQTVDWWKAIGRLAEEKGYLKKNKIQGMNNVYVIDLSSKGEGFLKQYKRTPDSVSIKLVPPMDIKKCLRQHTIKKPEPQKGTVNLPRLPTVLYDENDPEELKTYNQKLFVALRSFRNTLAHEIDCMPYTISSDTALMEMVTTLPQTIEDFINNQYNNFNQVKVENFGKRFVEFIKKFCLDNPPPQSYKKPTKVSSAYTLSDEDDEPEPKKMSLSSGNDKMSLSDFKYTVKPSLSNNTKAEINSNDGFFDELSDFDDELIAAADISVNEHMDSKETISTSDDSIQIKTTDDNSSTKNDFSYLLDDDDEAKKFLNVFESLYEENKNKELEDKKFLDDLLDDSPPKLILLKKNNINKASTSK